jgi:phosphonoacetaldehyde hydrolase
VVAFVELFRRHSVLVSEQEARAPMGAHKRDHIAALLANPDIRFRWKQSHGLDPDEATLNALYREFIPLQIEVLKDHCEVLPGIPEMTAELQRRGIPFSSTTGFTSDMMHDLIPAARRNGFNPELFVTPDLVGEGRPAPWMAFHAAKHMKIYPMSTIVKVGDTPADIAEALNAQMWAVSVVATGNEIGLSSERLGGLDIEERTSLFEEARAKFFRLGAHYVIDSSADLLPVIDDIGERIRQGEKP